MSAIQTQLEGIMTEQALADAALELEQERVERALAWDRARTRVREAHKQARCAVAYYNGAKAYRPAPIEELLAALDELERVEGGL